MATGRTTLLNWTDSPPSSFDIVTAYFPEEKPKGELRLRPCLVLDVLKGETSGKIALRIAYGTKNLKIQQRKGIDIIIQNHGHLSEIGLPMATRFNLDSENIVILPWTDEFFGCWSGYSQPQIGRLLETYIKDYAYAMMTRRAHNL